MALTEADLKASEAAVAEFMAGREKVFSEFISSAPSTLLKLYEMKDVVTKLRAIHCPEYCQHRPVLAHPTAGSATSGRDSGEVAADTAAPSTAWMDAAQCQEACSYDEKAIIFPSNEVLVQQYEAIAVEATTLSSQLSEVRVFISMNLPEMSEWNHPEVQNMTTLIAALEELNENEVTNSTKALLSYLTQRKGLEQKAFELPLHTVAQMLLVMDVAAWDSLELLYLSLAENLLNLHQLLSENQEIVQGGKFKKTKKHTLYA